MADGGPLGPVLHPAAMTASRQRRAETVLGHRFAAPALLEGALCHPSAGVAGALFERLEFLGDRVLGMAVADLLYAHYPDDPEGMLSRRLAALVRKETCAEILVELGLEGCLRLAGDARGNRTIQGDACEALIGALYLDGGYGVARTFVERGWKERLINPPDRLRDPKTRLQEWSLARGLGVPKYETVEREGPDHAPVFTVSVTIGEGRKATGQGSSKRQAEMAAAERLLEEAENE
ncbi:MAG: ribonuclease III [Flavobacteriaceae bacterium]